MYSNYNEFLNDCTNRIQSYISDSNIENEEKERIVSTFSRELSRFSIDSEGYRDFDIDYLIRSVSVRVIDDSLSLINSDINLDEYDYYLNLCKRQRENIYQFQSHNSWKLPSIKNDVDVLERTLINRKNDLETQKNKAEEDFERFKNLGNDYDGGLDNINTKITHKKDDFKTSLKKFFRIVGLACILFIVIALFGIFTYTRNRIKFPYSLDYVYENDYLSIYESLSEAGYTNIECVEDTSGWKKENSITGFIIDGDSELNKWGYYKPETKIEILYSSDNRIYLTKILNDWQKSDYEDVINKLRYAGFSNVKTTEIETKTKQKDKLISKITLDGIDYSDEDCYLNKKANIVIKYYRYKILIGSDNQGFINENYVSVFNKLKNKGFTDVTSKKIYDGWIEGNGVVNVVINNSTSYSDSDSFPDNSHIVVEYSSNDRRDASDIIKNYQNSSYYDLEQSFNEAGFENITVEKELTSNKNNNQKIVSISINGDIFGGDSCYIQEDSKIVIRYYFLEIPIGMDKEDIIDQDYLTIKNELVEKGFTNYKFKRSDDLITGWKNKESTVKSIKVDGKDDFESTDSYNYDVPIEIVVNTFKDKEYEGL